MERLAPCMLMCSSSCMHSIAHKEAFSVTLMQMQASISPSFRLDLPEICAGNFAGFGRSDKEAKRAEFFTEDDKNRRFHVTQEVGQPGLRAHVCSWF